MLKPAAMAFWTVYCPACVSESSGRVAVVATVGPAACWGAVPAGVVPVGTGAQSTPGASIPVSTPPSVFTGVSSAVSLPVGVSSAVSLPVGVSSTTSLPVVMSTPVSGLGWLLPPLLHAPIPSARVVATTQRPVMRRRLGSMACQCPEGTSTIRASADVSGANHVARGRGDDLDAGQLRARDRLDRVQARLRHVGVVGLARVAAGGRRALFRVQSGFAGRLVGAQECTQGRRFIAGVDLLADRGRSLLAERLGVGAVVGAAAAAAAEHESEYHRNESLHGISSGLNARAGAGYPGSRALSPVGPTRARPTRLRSRRACGGGPARRSARAPGGPGAAP